MNFALLVVPLVAGMLVGYFLHEKREINLGKLTLRIVLVLIFSLGFAANFLRELFTIITVSVMVKVNKYARTRIRRRHSHRHNTANNRALLRL